jgi:GMP reductase
MPSTFIIAGNVSTAAATIDLEAWGADAIKVGIGPGSACTTYVATGFGSRGAQASIVAACAKAKTKESTLIIADGGISEPGDIAKCLALGARMVMIGGMFSSLIDSPGTTIVGNDGRMYKEFWGSASSFQSGKDSRIEGTKKLMLLKNRTILQEMHYIKECIQSAISYGGGSNLECFKYVSYFIKGLN